ncbi:MAG: hypothetical protein M1118_09570 [Chloroflexi bacterium]|nr:hypothetical protein [Chloroflexota bacterium]
MNRQSVRERVEQVYAVGVEAVVELVLRLVEEFEGQVADVAARVAVLDRLGHGAVVLTITGRSYRLAHHQDSQEVTPSPRP